MPKEREKVHELPGEKFCRGERRGGERHTRADMARLRVAHTSWALTTKRKFNRPSDGFNGIASAACKIINDT